MNVLGIIPARYQSTRLPGKPLVDIRGKPMIQWVYEAAAKVLKHVYVATDDERILRAVKAFKGKAVMTPQTCPSGTDRCIAALPTIESHANQPFDIILNIQGDEPLLYPAMLEKLLTCFEDPATEIATLVNPIIQQEDIFNAVEAKVVFDKNYRALYFSRSPIPYVIKEVQTKWLNQCTFYKHVGLYAFKRKTLQAIKHLQQSSLEIAESLEQNRWLENGYTIKVAITKHESVPVDTSADLERVKRTGQ
ncbi:MAG: 3-deoxy-manno-octulosonate cytidylyltransferase [Cytophagales bacterium]|nr:3-deoxy-manno-octulosonate cytidylyltransferase [Cytophagales bacterium]